MLPDTDGRGTGGASPSARRTMSKTCSVSMRKASWPNGDAMVVSSRQAGAWAIEVRGLVPRSCFTDPVGTEVHTIFAQIVEGADITERLLLRLPE